MRTEIASANGRQSHFRFGKKLGGRTKFDGKVNYRTKDKFDSSYSWKFKFFTIEMLAIFGPCFDLQH